VATAVLLLDQSVIVANINATSVRNMSASSDGEQIGQHGITKLDFAQYGTDYLIS